jgi:spermidine synthase
MIPWELLDTRRTPDGNHDLTLHQRDQEYSIRIDRKELMNSRQHGSEEALATLAKSAIAGLQRPRILVGGLGMGFTLRAALASFPARSSIEVAELMSAVVEWNQGPLGHLADHPLSDPRVFLRVGDICDLISSSRDHYDAILLDVDNGPDGLTQSSNQWLYSRDGLACIRAALHTKGVLAVWSASDDAAFSKRLRAANFKAETHKVRARRNKKGARHIIWLAARDW